MKRLIVLFGLLIASAAIAELRGYLRTTGSVVCALLCGGGEIIVDSGPLVRGDYGMSIWLSTNSSSTQLQIQHRNAANNGNVKTFDIFLPTNSFVPLPDTLWAIGNDNERIRIVLVGPLNIGTRVSGALSW